LIIHDRAEVLSVKMWMWVRRPGVPATDGATKARETMAPKNSLICIEASLSMSSKFNSKRHGGSGNDPQRRNKIEVAKRKPKSSRVESTWRVTEKRRDVKRQRHPRNIAKMCLAEYSAPKPNVCDCVRLENSCLTGATLCFEMLLKKMVVEKI